MRILLLSFYYPPDIGPGSLRAKSIVDALIDAGPKDLKIDVITTIPNRYYSINLSNQNIEDDNKVSVQRISLPKHKNTMFGQVKAFAVFSIAVQKLIKNKKWNIVVATSSRLMTASLAALISKKTNSKLYLDIRDLFTDTINNMFEKKPQKVLTPIFFLLEKWTFRSAHKINIVSEGFMKHFEKLTPNLYPSVHTNGIDEIFISNNFLVKSKNSKPVVLYAGNIGIGQGLHKIIPYVANELKNIQFKVIGDGRALKLLTNNHLFKSQNNIELLSPILRTDLIYEYQKADILFLHLNNLKAFSKVLPSKIFEYAATGKPILAGVSGYAEKFLFNHVEGVQVFNPCDINEMKNGLQKLLNGPKHFNRNKFLKNYSRKLIMKKMANDILSLS